VKTGLDTEAKGNSEMAYLPLYLADVTKTGNGERRTGNGERGTGNGERGTGNGERGTGTGNGSLGTSVQR